MQQPRLLALSKRGFRNLVYGGKTYMGFCTLEAHVFRLFAQNEQSVDSAVHDGKSAGSRHLALQNRVDTCPTPRSEWENAPKKFDV